MRLKVIGLRVMTQRKYDIHTDLSGSRKASIYKSYLYSEQVKHLNLTKEGEQCQLK